MSEITFESIMNETSLWRRTKHLGINASDSIEAKRAAVPNEIRVCTDGENTETIERRYVVAQEIAGDNWIWSNYSSWYVDGQLAIISFHFRNESDAMLFKLSVQSL